MRAYQFIKEDSGPKFVVIDGIKRPTTNSNGQLIHPTDGGMVNFWKWFGDSKVVDKHGRPLVMYHGTASDFEVFGHNRDFTFFTTASDVASGYAVGKSKHGGSGSIYAMYLRIVSPLMVDANGSSWDDIAVGGIENSQPLVKNYVKRGVSRLTTDHVAEAAKKHGFDGAMIKRVNDGHGYSRANLSDVMVVIDPKQIKSAIGNRGGFDQSSNIIIETNRDSHRRNVVGYFNEIGNWCKMNGGVMAFPLPPHINKLSSEIYKSSSPTMVSIDGRESLFINADVNWVGDTGTVMIVKRDALASGKSHTDTTIGVTNVHIVHANNAKLFKNAKLRDGDLVLSDLNVREDYRGSKLAVIMLDRIFSDTGVDQIYVANPTPIGVERVYSKYGYTTNSPFIRQPKTAAAP